MLSFALLLFVLYCRISFVNSFFQSFPSTLSAPSINTIPIPKFPLSSFDTSSTNPPSLMYFTGAGVYVWWQLGVAKYIQEHYDRDSILNSIAIGASAGSITSAMLLANIDFVQAPKIAEKLAEKYQIYKRKSLGGVIGSMLDEWLQTMLSEDLDMNYFKNLYISLTPAKPSVPKVVGNFQDRNDLIQAIKASCHIPLFLDGRPCASYRNESVIDGSFWYLILKDRWILPFPDTSNNLDAPISNVLWVDYGDDEEFMKKISGNFIELITPQQMYEMFDMGYQYMRREAEAQNVPLKKLSFTKATVSTAKRIANTIPQEIIKNIPKSVDYFSRPVAGGSSRVSTLASAFSFRAWEKPKGSNEKPFDQRPEVDSEKEQRKEGKTAERVILPSFPQLNLLPGFKL